MRLIVKRNGQLIDITVGQDLELSEAPFAGSDSDMRQINAQAPSSLIGTLIVYGNAERVEAMRREGSEVVSTAKGIEVKKSSPLSQKITAFLLGAANNPNYVPPPPLATLASEIRAAVVKLAASGSCPECVKNDMLRQYRTRVADILTKNGLA